MRLGVLQRLIKAMVAFVFNLMLFGKKCLQNAVWLRLLRSYDFFRGVNMYIINNHLGNCLRKMCTFLHDIDHSSPILNIGIK